MAKHGLDFGEVRRSEIKLLGLELGGGDKIILEMFKSETAMA